MSAFDHNNSETELRGRLVLSPLYVLETMALKWLAYIKLQLETRPSHLKIQILFLTPHCPMVITFLEGESERGYLICESSI